MKNLKNIALVIMASFTLIAVGCKTDLGDSDALEGIPYMADIIAPEKVVVESESNDDDVLSTEENTNGYKVGDIILADGTKVDVAELDEYTIDENNKPVAIFAGYNVNGAALGLGIQASSNLAWAPKGTTGYKTTFKDIVGTANSGDMDGSDNWDVICSVDPEGTKDAAKNYPVFNFANNYGTNQGLTGELATGWYIPSIAELDTIFVNRETLQKSLNKVGGFIFIQYYWSSSQSASRYNYVYNLYFTNKTSILLNRYLKDMKNNVLVVHSF